MMILHDPKQDPKPQISPPESWGHLKMDEDVAFSVPNFMQHLALGYWFFIPKFPEVFFKMPRLTMLL